MSRAQYKLPRHARTEGPQPKRLPSNADYNVRRMRRNRPQREQMPDSSVQCMWPSKSQITNCAKPAVCVHYTYARYVAAKKSKRVTTILHAHVLSAKHAGFTVTLPKTALTPTGLDVDVDGLKFCSQNAITPYRRTLQAFPSKQLSSQ